MRSIKISDAKSPAGARLRTMIHLINLSVITASTLLLGEVIANFFGIDFNAPGRSQELQLVLSSIGACFALAILMYMISFIIIGWLFEKLKI